MCRLVIGDQPIDHAAGEEKERDLGYVIQGVHEESSFLNCYFVLVYTVYLDTKSLGRFAIGAKQQQICALDHMTQGNFKSFILKPETDPKPA